MSVSFPVDTCMVCAVMHIHPGMAAGCSDAAAPSPALAQTAAPGGTPMTMKNFASEPSVPTVKPGTVVTWINQGGALHTLVFDAGAPALFSSESLANGVSTKYTLTSVGTCVSHCPIHPLMKATVVARG